MEHVPKSLADRLRAIARRIATNVPRHDDPEQFHIEKSEIATDLLVIAKEIKS